MRKLIIIACLFLSLSIYSQEVNWLTFEEAVEMNKKEPKKIMIDVYTDWCGYCKVMDKNTFGNKVVADYMNRQYYPVKFNAEQREEIVFNEKTYKFVAQGSRGFHELAAALLNNQMSYPSIVFLDEQVRIIHVQKGYVKPQPFDEIIKFIGGDHFKTESWEEWKSNYNSPIAN